MSRSPETRPTAPELTLVPTPDGGFATMAENGRMWVIYTSPEVMFEKEANPSADPEHPQEQ